MSAGIVAARVHLLHHHLSPFGLVLVALSLAVFIVLVALVVRAFVRPAAPPSTPAQRARPSVTAAGTARRPPG